jgi:Uma2 family endonuclease
MPTAVTEAPYRPVPADPPRKRWTRAECLAAEAAGLFQNEHLELVEGELIDKMGKKRPHVNTLAVVAARMMRIFGDQFVNQEAPIDVAPQDNPSSEPEPDIVVLTRSLWDFPDANPQPSEIRLLVAVSETTLGFDLTKKAALYARAGIRDYWVFDVTERRLIVHREPVGGRYQAITAYSQEESVAPLAAPDALFPVGDAFRRPPQ